VSKPNTIAPLAPKFVNRSSMFLVITYEVTSQPSPRWRVHNRPPEGAGDPVWCEHERLQHPYTDPGDSTHESEISSADSVIDERRAHSQAYGHSYACGWDPEPRDPPAQREPSCRSDHCARDQTPAKCRAHGIDSTHDQVGNKPTNREADQHRDRPEPQLTWEISDQRAPV
jgi:hypothetical protein